MAELDPAFHALARLHRALAEPEDLDRTLDRIVTLSVDAVDGCDQASITVVSHGPTTAAHVGPDVVAVDAAQYEGGGPCVRSFEVQERISIPDIAADDRWPAFRDRALEHGIRSSLSYPMAVEGRALGSINLYGTRVAGFDEQSDRLAGLFADQASIALANAISTAEILQLADQLRDGLRHRDVIGQAKGILMAQRRITADAAFEVLREASQRSNRKLRDIAEDVARTGHLG